MVDPTSDLGEDVDEESAPECEICGEKIMQDPNHRVVTHLDDGVVQHHHFCSDECRDEWRADHDH